MDMIPHNLQKIVRGIVGGTFGLVVFFAVAELVAPPVSIAAPKTDGAQKTEKQCKTDRAKCQKACDQLIDIGDTVKRCKDLCTDDYLMCLPLRPSSQPGSKLGGVRPQVLPDTNAQIRRRGIEGEQPAEPASDVPTESTPAQP